MAREEAIDEFNWKKPLQFSLLQQKKIQLEQEIDINLQDTQDYDELLLQKR